MTDPVIDAIVRDIKAEAAALIAYRRAERVAEKTRAWAEHNGWDDEQAQAERLLGHLRGEIRELDTAQ